MLRSILCALATLAVASGQGCPDQVVKHVPVDVQFYGTQPCGTNIGGSIHGIEIKVPPQGCPIFAVIVPAHDEPMTVAGSNTYVVPNGVTAVRRVDFMCNQHWLAGIIPIVISVTCDIVADVNAGVVTHYVQRPCPVIPDPPSTR